LNKLPLPTKLATALTVSIIEDYLLNLLNPPLLLSKLAYLDLPTIATGGKLITTEFAIEILFSLRNY